jgi:folate-binding Fe-S cluster repair protein YgfZ
MSLQNAIDEHEPFLWSRIVVRGPASEALLQGQLSQDLTGLRESGAWSLLLDPTSDVLCTVALAPSGGGYELLVARSLAERALARLRRFHLRVDCTLSLEDAERGPYNTVGEQIDRAEPGPAEFLGLTPQCYGNSLVERTVSFTKGCFTGQELVARLDARGSSVPWRFVSARGPSLSSIEEVLSAKGPKGPKGVTSAVARDGEVLALGFLHRSALEDLGHDDQRVKVTVIH